MSDRKLCSFGGWNSQLKSWYIRSYYSRGAVSLCGFPWGRNTEVMTAWNGTVLMDMLLLFRPCGGAPVQRLPLFDEIHRARSFCCALLWATRGGTQKCLRKKLKPSGLLDQWLKWETENMHLGKKKALCSSVPSCLLCTEKKKKTQTLVIPLCRREIMYHPVLITVPVWNRSSLSCHPQVLHSPSFPPLMLSMWLWLWGETVRTGSSLHPWQGRTQPPRSSWNLRLNSSLRTQSRFGFVSSCKVILSSRVIFSSLFTEAQTYWRSVF